MTNLRVLIATLAVTSGCSVFLPDRPTTGAQANGQPLTIREDRVIEHEQYKERVGTIRDDEGHTLADIYESGTRTKVIPVWFGYQGNEYIDAEDYFRIAGDDDDRARVHRSRSLAYVANRGGWIATAAGIALIIATAMVPQDMPGRTAMFVTGLVGFGGGAPIAIWGATHLSPERHGVSSLDAAMAADQYNQKLGVQGGWSF